MPLDYRRMNARLKKRISKKRQVKDTDFDIAVDIAPPTIVVESTPPPKKKKREPVDVNEIKKEFAKLPTITMEACKFNF